MIDNSFDYKPDRVTEKFMKLIWSFWLNGIAIEEFLEAKNSLKDSL